MAWMTPGVTCMRSIRAFMMSFASTNQDESANNLVTPAPRHAAVTDGLSHSSRMSQEECKALSHGSN